MQVCWGLGEVETVGGLRVRYSMLDYELTSNPVAGPNHPAYSAARTALTSFKAVRRDPEAPAVVETRQQGGNTPIGKVVFLAGTSRRVGSITATYDAQPIPRFLPFLTGFRHDLSLITDHHLPRIINPPGTPRIIGWGEYSAVLDGEPVYICRFNAAASAWTLRSGQGVSRVAHAAIAAGAEYTWFQKTVKPTSALL